MNKSFMIVACTASLFVSGYAGARLPDSSSMTEQLRQVTGGLVLTQNLCVVSADRLLEGEVIYNVDTKQPCGPAMTDNSGKLIRVADPCNPQQQKC